MRFNQWMAAHFNDERLTEAKQGWDSCIADLRTAAEICREVEVERDNLRQRVQALTEAIEWALGQRGDFRPRGDGEGAHWWRRELRARAAHALTEPRPVPAESRHVFKVAKMVSDVIATLEPRP
jgi:hypothetical protein